MKALVFTVMFLSGYLNSFCQLSFQKKFSAGTISAGGASFHTIKKIPGNNFLITGSGATASNGGGIELIKLDNFFNPVFTKTYVAAAYSEAFDIFIPDNNHYRLSCSYRAIYPWTSLAIYNTDSMGNVTSANYYADSTLNYTNYCSAVTMDKGMLICGRTSDTLPSPYRGFIARTDSADNMLWISSIYMTAAFPSTLIINCVQEFPDGSVLASGYIDSGIYFFLRLDSSGNLIWSRFYRASSFNAYQTLYFKLLPSGEIFAWGKGPDFIMRLDSAGTILSFMQLSGITGKKTLNDNGTISIAGSNGTAPGFDATFAETDSAGTVLSAWVFNAGNYDNLFRSFCYTDDGGVIMAGQAADFSGTLQVRGYLVKIDSSNSSQCPYQNLYSFSVNANPYLTDTSIVLADSLYSLPKAPTSFTTQTTSSWIQVCISSGMEENLNDDSVLFVFPSLANQNLILKFNSRQNPTTIKVTTIFGSEKYHNIINDRSKEISIECSDWAPGIYFVSLNCGIQLITKKIIKQ